MKKKIISLLIATLLLMQICACAQTNQPEATDEGQPASSASEAPVTEPEQEIQSEAPQDEPIQSEEPADSQSNLEVYNLDDSEAITKAIEGSFDFSEHKAMLNSLTAQYPVVDEPATLSMWINFETTMLTYIEGNLLSNQTTFVELEKLTGVHLDLTVADSSTSSEKYNIMMAASDFPDLIPVMPYTTGPDAAIEDEIILPLWDIIDSYCLNYKTVLESNANLKQECQTPEGNYAQFCRIKDGVTTPGGEGAFMRLDWLEKLGMDVPETYDELYDVLMAFKTELGAGEPLLLKNTILPAGGVLTGGYGFIASVNSSAGGPGGASSTGGFYQIDGEVVYGAVTEEFKEFTLLMRKWYADGLISAECLTREQNPFASELVRPLTDGASGMFYGNQPFGDLYNGMSEDEEINYFPVRDVVKNPGDINPFYEEITLVAADGGLSITTNCKDVELAARWIDALYTPEASLLINYGIEGETWNYDEAGDPQFVLSLVDEFPSVNIFMATYTSQSLPGVYAESRLAFTFSEGAKASYEVWSTDKQNLYSLGNKTSLTAEEQQSITTTCTDILTYISEHYWLFITDEEDIEADWDNYLATIDKLGLPKVTATIQGAYDRAYK